MKIAHIVWGMETGGVETMLVNIINIQVKTESVALFIINNYIDENILEKLTPLCKVYKINRKPGSRNPIKILSLNYHLSLFNPDIIHVHSYKVSTLIWGRYPIVRTIHNTRNKTDEYNKMSALYAISEAVKDYTIKQGYNNVVVVENGIDVNSFKTKKQFHSPHITNIVQVGRLDIDQKGQDILLGALNILVTEKKRYNFVMHFIGTGKSELFLRNLVKELGLSEHVVFEGRKDQYYIQNNICSFDLFIQPSRYEGFGLTVAEAMAAKVPVLVSDIEGPMEIIDNGKYGMHFKKGDENDLADKLETILQGGYDYKKIEPAYDYVKTHYDVSITAKKYLEEYKKVINR